MANALPVKCEVVFDLRSHLTPPGHLVMTSIRKWAFLAVYIGVGTLVTPRIVQSHHTQPQTVSSADQNTKHHHHNHHKQLEISANQATPTVELVAHPDQVQGWNLELKVTHFNFAPSQVNAPSKTSEGHAHLYINGKKVTRLYGNWYYLSELPTGANTLKVTLNSNGHEALVHRGQPISDTAVIQVAPRP